MNMYEEIKRNAGLLLNESGIRIPKGSKAAKIIYHQDLDGVMSAILTLNQLEKQGIPRNRVKLASIQYGDNSDEVKQKLSASKGQMVALVDFARLPEGKDAEGLRMPDFWSDHHEQGKSKPNVQQANPKQKKKSVQEKKNDETKKIDKKLGTTIKNTRPSEVVKHRISANDKSIHRKGNIGKLLKANGEVNKGNDPYGEDLKIAAFLEMRKPGADINRIKEIIRNAKLDKKEYNKEILDGIAKIAKKEGIANKPQLGKYGGTVSTMIKDKKPITEAIGKTEFPSETEHLAKVHAQNLMTGEDIKAISMVDSAAYPDLSKLIDLPKGFKGKDRKERLVIIVNILLSGLLKANPNAVNALIKKSNVSLVSLYNNISKLAKLNTVQQNAIHELSKPSPDYAKVENARAKMPTKEMKGDIKKGGKIGSLASIDKHRKTETTQMMKQLDPETTRFKEMNKYIIVQDGKGEKLNRFLGSLITNKEGKVYPVNMRDWATMFQISMNPSLKMSDKGKINLAKGVDTILDGIIRDVNNGTIKVRDKKMTNWALKKVIKPEAGGHAGIATIGGLGTLGLAPKQTREDFKKIKAFKDKAYKSGMSGKEYSAKFPEKEAELERLQELKGFYAKERTMIINEIKKRIADNIEKAIETRKIEVPKGEDRFKMKEKKPAKVTLGKKDGPISKIIKKPMSIKEEILYSIKYWRN